MSGKITLTKWDAVESLKTEEDMALYIEACMEEGNPELVIAALGDVARARGIASLAKEVGITRQGMYKALSENGNPSFSLIMAITKALGIKQIGRAHV